MLPSCLLMPNHMNTAKSDFLEIMIAKAIPGLILLRIHTTVFNHKNLSYFSLFLVMFSK